MHAPDVADGLSVHIVGAETVKRSHTNYIGAVYLPPASFPPCFTRYLQAQVSGSAERGAMGEGRDISATRRSIKEHRADFSSGSPNLAPLPVLVVSLPPDPPLALVPFSLLNPFAALCCIGTSRWEVRKRYSEFEALHKSLKAIKDSSGLASLPKKVLFGKLSEAVVKQRQEGLNTYLNALLHCSNQHRRLLMAFLQAPTAAGWANAEQNSSAAASHQAHQVAISLPLLIPFPCPHPCKMKNPRGTQKQANTSTQHGWAWRRDTRGYMHEYGRGQEPRNHGQRLITAVRAFANRSGTTALDCNRLAGAWLSIKITRICTIAETKWCVPCPSMSSAPFFSEANLLSKRRKSQCDSGQGQEHGRGQTERRINRYSDRYMDGWINGRIQGWMDGIIGG